jgi:hypothetical protein
MNRCTFLGHDNIHDSEPHIDTNSFTPITVLDHCNRCHKITGAWIWYKKQFHYFKK